MPTYKKEYPTLVEDIIPPDTMTILPQTYTCDAATCLTFFGRTAEAVGGIGRAKITHPHKP